jgi:hypothetical protein
MKDFGLNVHRAGFPCSRVFATLEEGAMDKLSFAVENFIKIPKKTYSSEP